MLLVSVVSGISGSETTGFHSGPAPNLTKGGAADNYTIPNTF